MSFLADLPVRKPGSFTQPKSGDSSRRMVVQQDFVRHEDEVKIVTSKKSLLIHYLERNYRLTEEADGSRRIDPKTPEAQTASCSSACPSKRPSSATTSPEGAVDGSSRSKTRRLDATAPNADTDVNFESTIVNTPPTNQ